MQLLIVFTLRHIRRAGGPKQEIVNRTLLFCPPAERSCFVIAISRDTLKTTNTSFGRNRTCDSGAAL